ncbi:hypothetical protein MJT46_009620 [Ovis ammon polii x Ovis aries]|nr:hypothetical protein MJT46_009620 [Ovis ammon polii x Ovis aries]
MFPNPKVVLDLQLDRELRLKEEREQDEREGREEGEKWKWMLRVKPDGSEDVGNQNDACENEINQYEDGEQQSIREGLFDNNEIGETKLLKTGLRVQVLNDKFCKQALPNPLYSSPLRSQDYLSPSYKSAQNMVKAQNKLTLLKSTQNMKVKTFQRMKTKKKHGKPQI